MEEHEPRDPLREKGFEMAIDKESILRFCLRVLIEGGEVAVEWHGIWTREFHDTDELDDDSGWELTFPRSNRDGEDETAGVIRDTVREYILGHLDDYDQARYCLDGLCLGSETGSRRSLRRRWSGTPQ